MLGLLGKIAAHPCLLEPYRNAVNLLQIRACWAKLLAVEAEMVREFKKQKRGLSDELLPNLWILTPTASQSIINGFKAEQKPDWEKGIYFCGELLRMAIVVIHQLPVNSDTLLLRLFGKGKVQSQAINEVKALEENHPLKSTLLTQLYNLQQNLSLQTETDVESKELIMRLAPLYQQDRAQAVQEGEANLLIYLLHKRLGQLSSALLIPSPSASRYTA